MIQRKDVAIYAGYRDLPQLARLQFPVVLGDWPACPKAVLVGEAPGGDEQILGHPFVGRAGRRLDHLLMDAGLDRDQLGVTNIVKARPMDAAKARDRAPSVAEVQVSLPYLWRELEVMASGHTRVLCAMGRTAIKALSAWDGPVGQAAGTWRVVTDPVGVKWAMFATYHPSAALRDPDINDMLAKLLRKFHGELQTWGTDALAQLG